MLYLCQSSLGGVVVSSLRSEAESLGSIPGEAQKLRSSSDEDKYPQMREIGRADNKNAFPRLCGPPSLKELCFFWESTLA